jgi:hypothetical protein
MPLARIQQTGVSSHKTLSQELQGQVHLRVSVPTACPDSSRVIALASAYVPVK